MRRIILTTLIILGFGYCQAQNTLAKLKFEDAQEAYNKGEYANSLALLDETEKLLGKSAPNILHLRILSEGGIWEADPYKSYDQVIKLRNLCSSYMENYDIKGLENNFRDVYELSKRIPEVNNQQELAQLGEHYKQEKTSNKFNEAIDKNNLIFVQGGTYEKGSQGDAHEVTVSDFYIGKYEITVKDWNDYLSATGKTGQNNTELKALLRLYSEVEGLSEAVMGVVKNFDQVGITNLYSGTDSLKDIIPTEGNSAFYRFLPARAHKKKSLSYLMDVLYPEIMAYCQWLEDQYGGTWRLPTDAEWEFASRNGSTAEHINNKGDRDKIKQYYSDEIPVVELPHAFSATRVVNKPVGRKSPNALGLYDMMGNVSEMCYDYYDRNYHKYSPKDDPKGPAEGKYRVKKGANIFLTTGVLEYADENAIGFRVVYIPSERQMDAKE